MLAYDAIKMSFVRASLVGVMGALLAACSGDSFVTTAPDGSVDGSASVDAGRDGSSCPLATCNGVCIDTQSDNANCGKCNNVCPAFATCTAGACSCDKGKRCGNKCVFVDTDPDNCGQCGNKCGADGGVSSFDCIAGHCTPGCGLDQTSCNGVCYDLKTTDEHCGTCDNDCTKLGQSCCNGTCTALLTDKNNCGACGTVCSSNCKSGKCCNTPSVGTCNHDLCTPGSALTPGCDPSGCVSTICASDSFCCSTNWDTVCSGEVATKCKGLTCTCQ